MLEFLRVEALLRSAEVHRIFNRAKKSSTERLFKKYGITWGVLQGQHHRYLDPNCHIVLSYPEDANDPGADLWARAGIGDLKARGERHLIFEHDLPYSYFCINHAKNPQTILDGLKPILEARHATCKMQHFYPVYSLKNTYWTSSVSIPHSSSLKPAISNFSTWVRYLHCYDLRTCEGLAFGPIAQTVYGLKTARPRAEIGFKRAKRLIILAEKNRWPPWSEDLH